MNIADIQQAHLSWFPELQMGWFPVVDSPYDAAYWDRYRAMDLTDMGAGLTAARVDLVRRFYDGADLCDIGIGGGRFVEDGGFRGFDINPAAVQWLRERGAYQDPYAAQVDALSFWDSLEHIHNPLPLLAMARRWVFVSIPIFSGPEHVLASRHYRRDEHCLYFTRQGFTDYMVRAGFELVERTDVEQRLGREDIETFAFRRVGQ